MADKETPKPDVKPPAEPKKDMIPYWLVVVRDESDNPPMCVRCEGEDALGRALTEHVLSAEIPLHAFAFSGERVAISAPRPICSFILGNKKIDVGQDSDEYDEGGLIIPLAKPKTVE